MTLKSGLNVTKEKILYIIFLQLILLLEQAKYKKVLIIYFNNIYNFYKFRNKRCFHIEK